MTGSYSTSAIRGRSRLYKHFLKDGGIIEFKTDNDDLFRDSLVYFEQAGFETEEVCGDFYSSHDVDTSVITEHEGKFMQMGLPIHYARVMIRKKLLYTKSRRK